MDGAVCRRLVELAKNSEIRTNISVMDKSGEVVVIELSESIRLTKVTCCRRKSCCEK